MFQRIAIVGLGLIGGSLGLALHQMKAVEQIRGYDQAWEVCEHAMRIGAIDQAFDSLRDTVCGADVVILATPVGPMKSLLQQLAPVLTPGTIVTDVASTKAQVLTWAAEFLPTSVSFVGGHPMTGREVSGVAASDPDLFSNRIYCLTPTAHTPSSALEKVLALIELVGARAHFLDPEEHDKLVASVSHLPFVASIALVRAVAQSDGWKKASMLAATGFRDTSRLAAGSPEMHRDICLTNSDAITRWLDDYIATLSTLRNRIAQQDDSLVETFREVQRVRLQWQAENDEST